MRCLCKGNTCCSLESQTRGELQDPEATNLASEQHTSQAKPEGVGESHL